MSKLAGWLLAALAFLLPFEMIGAFGLAGTTLRLPQITGYVVVLFFLVELTRGGVKLRRTAFLPVILLAAVTALSAMILGHPRGWINYLAFLLNLLIVVAIGHLLNKENLRIVVRGLYAGAFVAALVALWQYVGDVSGIHSSLTGLRAPYQKTVLGFPRVHGPASEPLYLGNILLLPLLLSFASSLVSRSLLPKMLFGFLSFALVLTTSRGALLAGALGVLLVYALTKRSRQTIALRPLLIAMAALGLAGLGLLALPAIGKGDALQGPRTFIELSTTRLLESPSYNERVSGVSQALRVLADRPVIGVGVGQFRKEDRPYPNYRLGYDEVHIINFWLALAVETGVLGVGLFGWFIFRLYFGGLRALRDPSRERSVLLAGSVAALVAVMLQLYSFYALNFIHVWFLLGWVAGLVGFQEKRLGAGASGASP